MRGVIVTTVLFLSVSMPAHAAVESELVQKGLEDYDKLDFEGAIAALNEALEESLTREERIVTFRTLAFAYAALDRADDARGAFVRLLRVDGAAELDRSVAPKVRALFEQARAQVATGRGDEAAGGVPLPTLQPTVEPKAPRDGHPVTIAVKHQGGVAREVHLFHRVRGSDRYSEVKSVAVDGRFELTLGGDEVRAPALEYYLIVVDDSGAAVARAGTLGQPLRVEVTAPPSKKPIYKRGWFWGVVGGVVVAGAVVGAVLATTLGQPDPKAPADVTLIAPR